MGKDLGQFGLKKRWFDLLKKRGGGGRRFVAAGRDGYGLLPTIFCDKKTSSAEGKAMSDAKPIARSASVAARRRLEEPSSSYLLCTSSRKNFVRILGLGGSVIK